MILPQNPIFVVGYPRSGTTLLQRLLSAHSGIFTFPETHYFCVIEKQIQFDSSGNVLPSCLEKVFEKVYEKMEFTFLPEEKECLRKSAEAKTLTSKKIFEFIVGNQLSRLYPDIHHKNSFRWLEKTPNHAHYLERMIQFYPRAQIIHILRHPVPAIFSRKLKFPFNRETPLTELALRWNRMMMDVERFRQSFSDRIHTLRYEELISDLEKELKIVKAFLDIHADWNAASIIRQEDAARGFILPSETWKLKDVKRDIVSTNACYKSYFSPEDARTIEAVTGEHMKKYGYEPYMRCEGGI